MSTIRQDIIEALKQEELSALDLSQFLRISEKEVYSHLPHVVRTVEAQGYTLQVNPARCLSCDYVFRDRQRLTPPGRCPRCKKGHLTNPVFHIV